MMPTILKHVKQLILEIFTQTDNVQLRQMIKYHKGTTPS